MIGQLKNVTKTLGTNVIWIEVDVTKMDLVLKFHPFVRQQVVFSLVSILSWIFRFFWPTATP